MYRKAKRRKSFWFVLRKSRELFKDQLKLLKKGYTCFNLTTAMLG
jgi:hypothetical protein